MRKIALLVALTALGTLAGPAVPAFAGPIREGYDGMRHSAQGEQFCAGMRFVHRQVSDQPKAVRTAVRLTVNRFFGCDANGSEFWYGIDNAVFGPVDDLGDTVNRLSGDVEGGACAAYDALADGFEEQGPGTPEPFATAAATVAQGVRIVEAVHCTGTLPPTSPGDALGRLPRPKSVVPAEMVVVYDVATVLPCGFAREFARQFPPPVGPEFTPLYYWLDCADNQFLPASV